MKEQDKTFFWGARWVIRIACAIGIIVAGANYYRHGNAEILRIAGLLVF